MPHKCQVEIEVLTRMMWMFTVFLTSAKKIKHGETSKDVQYFVVKGGLTLASKIVIEREKMPEYIKYRAPELLKACMAVIAQSAVGCETETRTQLKMAGVIEALMSVIEDYFKGMLPV